MTGMWRSRKVAWLAVLLAFGLIAAACGDSDDTGTDETTAAPTETEAPEETTTTAEAPAETTTTAAAETTTTVASGPVYGGEAVFGQDQEPPTLNPYVPGGDNFTVAIAGQQYWAGVYEVDGFTLELIPELLTELPTLANGGVVLNDDGTMTVNYTIRDEAVWSDGVPITGDDIQFTLDTILDPDLPTDKTTYQDIIATEVGDKTFSFTLSAPTVLYELMFGPAGAPIIPKHDVEGTDFLNDWNDAMWVSAGAFVFDSWQKGETLTVVKNENYWKKDADGNQLPFLDSITTRFVPETEALINAFRAREVDVINPPPSTDAIETLQGLEGEGAVVEVLSGPIWEHLNFQFGPDRLEMNADSSNESLAYRKGVAHAIDKKLIVDEILAGQVEPLDSFVEAYNPMLSLGAWLQYDYNPEAAIALIDEAKIELGKDVISTVFTTTSNNDARVKLSELFVDMFGAVGIDYENQLEDSQLFFGETLDNGKWDLGEWAWVGSPGLSGLVGVMDVFDPEAPPPDGSNFYRWGTPDSSVIDDATARFAVVRDEMNATVDEAVLVPLINEAEQILADQVVIIPLYARLDAGVVWGDEIGNFKHNPTSSSLLWNVEEWYRVDL